MAQFTNQATLSYGDTVTTSNIALGEVLEVLSATKTAVNGVYYGQNDTITYIISLINSGAVPLNNLTVTDNLGTFDFGTGTLTPLVYTTGSVKYYQNGVISPSPVVTTSESQVVFSGISVPANGNATLAYEVTVNNLAPLDEGAEITNVATINGGGVTPISASETVTSGVGPNISITKSISPVPVADGATVTYTFVIENTGNRALVATDNAVVTDVFTPILSNVTATLNGVPIAFTYDETTGEFSTAPSAITVPGATYTQDLTTGLWSITPGAATLIVSGTI
jgi:hypothetical protein